MTSLVAHSSPTNGEDMRYGFRCTFQSRRQEVRLWCYGGTLEVIRLAGITTGDLMVCRCLRLSLWGFLVAGLSVFRNGWNICTRMTLAVIAAALYEVRRLT